MNRSLCLLLAACFWFGLALPALQAQVHFGVPVEGGREQVQDPPVAEPEQQSSAEGLGRLFDNLYSEAQKQTWSSDQTPQVVRSTQNATPKLATGSLFNRQWLMGSVQAMLMVSILSLAPAILLMTTCYVRVVVVMGLLRQALGTGQLPPNQIITSISIFITLFVMAPVWNRVYTESIQPFTAEGSQMSAAEAWQAGVSPVREFMFKQILAAGNKDDIHLFYSYYAGNQQPVRYQEDVPLQVLLPAFMLSELKTAFLMGFMIFMPFLVIDLVVTSVTISMGMMMLPPALISLPFKLLLFVLVDGWHLVVVMLLKSFGTIG